MKCNGTQLVARHHVYVASLQHPRRAHAKGCLLGVRLRASLALAKCGYS